jgi:hypothetical protein
MLRKAGQTISAQQLLGCSRRNFGAIVTASKDHKFISGEVNRKTMAFDGMKATSLYTMKLDNTWRHHNDLPLTQ